MRYINNRARHAETAPSCPALKSATENEMHVAAGADKLCR
jgi:hypothetical protein